MAATTKPILYSYWRSSCSWRVRIALAFKDIDYELKPVNLIKDGGEQRTSEYEIVNPMKHVPTLCWRGCNVAESVAIMEFLEEVKPNPSLFPTDLIQRAQVRQICQIIAGGIQPLQNLKVLQYVGETKMEWGKHWIHQGFVALERLLKQTSSKYSVGDAVTMADCCLVPQVYNANRFNIDMSEFPTINRIHEACSELELFKKAHPSVQIDCPEDQRSV